MYYDDYTAAIEYERSGKCLIEGLTSVTPPFSIFSESAFIKRMIYLACPNRRVAHLMYYGKSRTQKKNYKRASKLIAKGLNTMQRNKGEIYVY